MLVLIPILAMLALEFARSGVKKVSVRRFFLILGGALILCLGIRSLLPEGWIYAEGEVIVRVRGQVHHLLHTSEWQKHPVILLEGSSATQFGIDGVLLEQLLIKKGLQATVLQFSLSGANHFERLFMMQLFLEELGKKHREELRKTPTILLSEVFDAYDKEPLYLWEKEAYSARAIAWTIPRNILAACKNLSSQSTEAAKGFVAPVLEASSSFCTLNFCAPSTPCPSSASATVKTGSTPRLSFPISPLPSPSVVATPTVYNLQPTASIRPVGRIVIPFLWPLIEHLLLNRFMVGIFSSMQPLNYGKKVDGFFPLTGTKKTFHYQVAEKGFKEAVTNKTAVQEQVMNIPYPGWSSYYQELQHQLEPVVSFMGFYALPTIEPQRRVYQQAFSQALPVNTTMLGPASLDVMQGLLKEEYWFDGVHPQGNGAILFTEWLAQEIVNKWSELEDRRWLGVQISSPLEEGSEPNGPTAK